MPKKRSKKKRPKSHLVLQCPLCADHSAAFDAAGKLTLHLMEGHTVAQLATEIMYAVLDRAR